MLKVTIATLLGVTAGLVIVLAGAWFLWPSEPSEPSLLFVEEGIAWVEQEGGFRELTAPDEIAVRNGYLIRTGPGSRALVAPAPGVSAVLEGGSEVVVRSVALSDAGTHAIDLQVNLGETLHQWSSSSKVGHYEVNTPGASVLLSPGQCYIRVSGDGQATVEVHQGSAWVSARDSTVQVWAGEYTTSAPGSAPSVPRPVVARFAFASERSGNTEIWLVDEEGQEVQVTYHPAADLTPVWSPDGTQIAFVSWRDGNGEVYVMEADGSNQSNLTIHEADDFAPSWSPDGRYIAFESVRDGQSEVYIMQADGSEPTRLTFGPGISLGAHWDLAGSEIIFSRIDSDTNGDGSIDANDLASLFSVGPEGGAASACWDTRLVYDQMIFPWVRRQVS